VKNKNLSVNLNVKNNLVAVMKVNGVDYISLTDLAKYKNPNNPSDVINKWMTNKDSFDFYCLWEELFNKNFNLAESREIKINEVGYNSFTMSPTKWKKRTNAIGILSSSGRYSKGCFAHPDIALEFASWIDTSFKLYLIKEFERLKTMEAVENNNEWSVRRSLSKTNYKIHTNLIKENLLPTISNKQKKFIYLNEADVLNVALFGITAKEWKKKNQNLKGNIRDNTDILHLVVLNNLEAINSEMISNRINQKERLEKLNDITIKQLSILYDNNNIKKLDNIDKINVIE